MKSRVIKVNIKKYDSLEGKFSKKREEHKRNLYLNKCINKAVDKKFMTEILVTCNDRGFNTDEESILSLFRSSLHEEIRKFKIILKEYSCLSGFTGNCCIYPVSRSCIPAGNGTSQYIRNAVRVCVTMHLKGEE